LVAEVFIGSASEKIQMENRKRYRSLESYQFSWDCYTKRAAGGIFNNSGKEAKWSAS
jgi:hypothetical protein